MKVKEIGLSVVGLAFFVGLAAIGIGLLTGLAAFSVWVLKWTFPAFLITFLISIVVLTPLALIPATRAFSAIGFLLASYAFGAILWIWGMAYAYTAWGLIAVIVGLVLAGVGVVPVAMVAALVHGDWGNLGFFAVVAVLTFGVRALAHWLDEKAALRAARRSEITVPAHRIAD
jgi:hypothetical protein